MTYRKKLIEVALPLEAINKESAREKSIRHGHPSTLHLWWARRPLAACRAVLFASIVDDPSSNPEMFPTEEDQTRERDRLFRMIEEMVKWDNINNEELWGRIRAEIQQATGGNPPPVLDPFAGGGSIPLEAQRLGLEAHASDLNPVAVLINKALIEIPPKFAGQPPVNPEARQRLGHSGTWKGAAGLAEDVRYYGQWMRDEAERRIGHLYPKVQLSKEHGGGEATVIAWLWARTVQCPNPACGAQMPLVTSFWLSTKKGKEVWAEPIVDRSQQPPKVNFEVRSGEGKAPESPKVGRGAKFRCLACGQVAEDQHIKSEAMAERMGSQLMAMVVEGNRHRIYLAPMKKHEGVAQVPELTDIPTQPLANDPRNIWCVNYGLDTIDKLFTPRQLVALTTFSDLTNEVREQVRRDALAAMMHDDRIPLSENGRGATGYADAVAVYLAFALSKMADRGSSICTWFTERDSTRNTFARQAIPMTWDYAELNTLLGGTGSFLGAVEWTAESFENTDYDKARASRAIQADLLGKDHHAPSLISTDPPYCLTPGTFIQTPSGFKPIEEIQEGDQVLTHLGRFASVTRVYQHWYEGPVHQLKTAHFNLTLTLTPLCQYEARHSSPII